MKKIADIQYITQNSKYLSHAQQAKLMFLNGITWVQIRMKNCSHKLILEQSAEALQYAKKYKGTLIINDSVEIAKEIKAHGVHLGLNDIPVNDARAILGEKYIIGGTANTFHDIELQANYGADYIGLGPFRFTTTKNNLSPIIGLEGYKTIAKNLKRLKIKIPVVAVGGVTLEDISPIKKAGLHGAAISGALLKPFLEKMK